MPKERRNGDILIMDKLSLMHTELALNTQATQIQNKQLEEQVSQLKTLNGKVAAHESRLQALESNQALISTNLASSSSKKGEWLDWVVKGGIVTILALFYYILRSVGFPDFFK